MVQAANYTVEKKIIPVLKMEDFEQGIVDNDNEYLKKFRDSILDQQKDYPLPIPVINLHQNGETIPFLTLKSFSLWQGKQKSKKTVTLAVMVAAYISHIIEISGTYFSCGEAGRVIWFDNEQGESYAARTMKLILKIACISESENLIYCDLREFQPNERMKIIQAGIEGTPNVRLVIVDGLVDLLNDFMDASEGHLTTTEILKLCSLYNVHVAGVLHQNKNDKNARAHVGTISSQKCEMEIQTEVDANDKSQSIVSCINSRGLPFEPLAIRWDKGSLPCIVQEWSELKASDVKANKNYENAKEITKAVFKPLAAISHSEAISRIMNITLKSESTAKRLLNDLQGWELIKKGVDGNYRINNEGSKVHEGSNEGS